MCDNEYLCVFCYSCNEILRCGFACTIILFKTSAVNTYLEIQPMKRIAFDQFQIVNITFETHKCIGIPCMCVEATTLCRNLTVSHCCLLYGSVATIS